MKGIINPTVSNSAKALQLASGIITSSSSNAPVSGYVFTAISATDGRWLPQNNPVGSQSGVTGIGITGSPTTFLTGAIALINSGDVALRYSGNNIVIGAESSGASGFLHLNGNETVFASQVFSGDTTFLGTVNQKGFTEFTASQFPQITQINYLRYSYVTGINPGTITGQTTFVHIATGYLASSGAFFPTSSKMSFLSSRMSGSHTALLVTAHPYNPDSPSGMANAVAIHIHNMGIAGSSPGIINMPLTNLTVSIL